MAFLEWRKFNFFDLKRDVDNKTLTSKLNDTIITAAANGDNQIYLGDSLGQIHTVIRNWHVSTFAAYSLRVLLAFKVKLYLITIGEDEEGINPVIKVWDTNRLDKNEAPFCTRITKAIPNNTAVQANTLCVHDNSQLMAVGFIDGSLILYRGDITRDRSSKPKLLRNASSAITGLAFKNSLKSVMLFVSTENAVYVYNITHKDKETMLQLDTEGCEKNCSILAQTLQGSHFMVARNDAVYCYTADGRGPCYAIEGTKVMLEWFRTYLIIISRSNRIIPPSQQGAGVVMSSSPTSNVQATPPPSTLPAMMFTITVLDIKNKFIVFTAPINTIRSLINELGSFYLLDSDNHLHQLDEKDLQSKLQVLFKKNLYDVAIRIAESQKHDPEALVDIFRQYGDHLYGKGDHGGAIEQYIRTIGRLEPSYVIRKFLDSQHIERLTSYLQAVHKKGRATADHTTLLLNCFTKLNKTENLKEFILQKDKDLVFNVDIAIKVCRHASPEEALMLAKRHGKHDLYINYLLEDHKKYSEAINYISTLKFEEAELYMRKYGYILVENAPNESTLFLKRLCTNFNNTNHFNNSENSDNMDGSISAKENILSNGIHLNGIELQKADPFDFMSFFVGNSEKLVEFLEYLIAEQCQMSSNVYDSLLEHYLYVWESQKTPPEKAASVTHILSLLHNPEARYDRTQALLLCHQRSFAPGVLHLYERDKLYGQILSYHQERGDYDAVVACCRRFGHMEPGLWLQALKCVTKNGGHSEEYKKALRRSSLQEIGSDLQLDNEDEEISAPPVELLHEILNVIAKERLLSPQQVIETIHASARSDITLAHTDSYLINELKREQQLTTSDEELTAKYRVDTEKLRLEIEGLRTGNTIIQVSRCAACHYQLELPSLHFLCQHSYHQYCFQSVSDTDQATECPVCRPDNQQLLELLKARGCSRDTHETFHDQLDKSADGISLAAEYFGRGVFDRLIVVTDANKKKDVVEVKGAAEIQLGRNAIEPKKENGAGASSIIIKSKPPFRPDPTMNINYSNYGPGAEAKMRQEENLRMSNPMVIKPMSEGRIRMQEQRYSSSMEKGQSYEARKVDIQVKKIVELPVKKPFDAPNPFDEPTPSNPFDEEEMDEAPDDYDKDGKNPFFEGEHE